ncbi:putative nucleotidyltransferase [Sporomusaceae bacterium BoRhaA]|uniref:nucleotidyltransferase family protein n=1 Tax=Pelorhabdus rhamnosifermentans TaxID=2772457 RepID=UPI001C0603F6|nr:nucleotidyltransferase domain-containing protein [Pelorhabdus rhamnosifermentans]MBU2700768.1 putative nucleotidyltransferase [Pelorhabdus rhamnosifermentans]
MNCALPNKLVYEIRAVAKKYAVKRIVLFGSRARGDNKFNSDIDIAVYPLPEFMSRGYFFSEIDDLETLLKIDVVFIDSHTDTKLLENISKEGVVIYERL